MITPQHKVDTVCSAAYLIFSQHLEGVWGWVGVGWGSGSGSGGGWGRVVGDLRGPVKEEKNIFLQIRNASVVIMYSIDGVSFAKL